MGAYVIRRLLWLPFMLFIVSFLTFALCRFGPGDPVSVAAGQIRDPAVLAQLRSDEQPCFLPESVAQVLIEFRIRIDVGHDTGELADCEPLTREVVHQRLRPMVGEHPPYLPFERGAVAERAFRRGGKQLVIRDAAPEEERQS